MFKNKQNNLFLTVGVLLGASMLRLYAERNKFKSELEVQTISNDITNSVLGYTATYFKDSEYFEGKPKPQNYYQNWKQLSMILDKIRRAYGFPILIIKGYQVPLNGVISNNFNQCREVWIFPSAGYSDVNQVVEVVKALVNSGQINITKWSLNDNKTIQIIL